MRRGHHDAWFEMRERSAGVLRRRTGPRESPFGLPAVAHRERRAARGSGRRRRPRVLPPVDGPSPRVRPPRGPAAARRSSATPGPCGASASPRRRTARARPAVPRPSSPAGPRCGRPSSSPSRLLSPGGRLIAGHPGHMEGHGPPAHQGLSRWTGGLPGRTPRTGVGTPAQAGRRPRQRAPRESSRRGRTGRSRRLRSRARTGHPAGLCRSPTGGEFVLTPCLGSKQNEAVDQRPARGRESESPRVESGQERWVEASAGHSLSRGPDTARIRGRA